MIIAYSFKHDAWAKWRTYSLFTRVPERVSPYFKTAKEANICKPQANPPVWPVAKAN